ncbi:MAG: YigZ family protein [Flavobacteriaceae bacterium]|jgi:uncharacterized YigZ family protein|nr:YigZ family protein [Flavobacteriaceae bacterium]
MPCDYQTIKEKVENVLLKEKGSRFIGYLYQVENEGEIKKRLDDIYALHPKATHHCYAYRLGLNGGNYRANDDGEPSGTAGLPIYNQLLSVGVTNVLLIIVRYFGGTKLGTGGLVKTYRESAQLVLEQAEIITKELTELYQLEFDYSHQAQVTMLIKKLNLEIKFSEFTDKCRLTLIVPMRKKEDFFEKFDSLFAQNFVIQNKVS